MNQAAILSIFVCIASYCFFGPTGLGVVALAYSCAILYYMEA